MRLRFPSKTSRDLRHVLLYTLSFNFLKNAQCLLSCRPFAARPKLTPRLYLSGSLPCDTAFNGYLFRLPSRSPCGFHSGNLPTVTFRNPRWRGCIKSGDKSIFQSTKTRYFLTLAGHSCEPSLARSDFLRKFSGTCEPSDLRLFCYNIEKNTQHFWLSGYHRIAPCDPELRPVCGADLATCTIWLQTQLRTFGLFHHFWVTLYG